MAGDLERFLQQAAERLAEKVNKPQGKRQPPKPKPPSVRAAERSRLNPDAVDAEILEAEIIPPHPSENRRELGPDPLSNIDTRPGLAREVGFADEKMEAHIHEQLDHDIGQLKDASAALSRSREDSNAPKVTHAEGKAQQSIVKMLRNPDTIRTAFIASEIFKRKV